MWIRESEKIGFESEEGERERMSRCVERTGDHVILKDGICLGSSPHTSH